MEGGLFKHVASASTVGKQPFNFKALRSHWMHVTCFPSYNKRAMSVFCEHFLHQCLAAGACSSGPIKQLSTPNPLIFRCLSCYYGSAHPQDFFYSREKRKKENINQEELIIVFAKMLLWPTTVWWPLKVFCHLASSEINRFDFFLLHSYSQMLCTEATAAK